MENQKIFLICCTVGHSENKRLIKVLHRIERINKQTHSMATELNEEKNGNGMQEMSLYKAEANEMKGIYV